MKGQTFPVSVYVLLFCLMSIFFLAEPAFAEEAAKIKGTLRIPDSNQVQMLYTIDGTKLVGRITEIGDEEIKFQTDIGVMSIPVAKITEIKEIPLSAIRRGAYWFPNPNYTRLYVAPTGRPLKAGEGYFADYYLFFPMVAYGITNNITIAGGMSLFPWIGLENNLIYLTPKIGFSLGKNSAISLGLMLVKLPSFGDEVFPTVGIAYGVGTLGSLNASLSGGLGYGFVDWEFADTPMWMLGGEYRLTRSISFVTENWFLPGVDDPLISYGIRFFGEKLSVDLAFWNTIDFEAFPGIPYIDFVVKF